MPSEDACVHEWIESADGKTLTCSICSFVSTGHPENIGILKTAIDTLNQERHAIRQRQEWAAFVSQLQIEIRDIQALPLFGACSEEYFHFQRGWIACLASIINRKSGTNV